MVSDFDEQNATDIPVFLLHLGDVVYSFGEAAYYYDQFYDVDPDASCSDHRIGRQSRRHGGAEHRCADVASFPGELLPDRVRRYPGSGRFIAHRTNPAWRVLHLRGAVRQRYFVFTATRSKTRVSSVRRTENIPKCQIISLIIFARRSSVSRTKITRVR